MTTHLPAIRSLLAVKNLIAMQVVLDEPGQGEQVSDMLCTSISDDLVSTNRNAALLLVALSEPATKTGSRPSAST